MSFILLAVVMPILAQADHADKIYEFTPKKGGEPFYAVIIDDKDSASIKIRYIEQGKESIIETKLKSEFDWVEVSAERARKAITAKLDKSTVDVGGGVRVAEEEVALAKRAREKAEALEERVKPSAPQAAAVAETAPVESAPKTPFVRQWGPQIALLIGAVALVGIIVKLVILSE